MATSQRGCTLSSTARDVTVVVFPPHATMILKIEATLMNDQFSRIMEKSCTGSKGGIRNLIS